MNLRIAEGERESRPVESGSSKGVVSAMMVTKDVLSQGSRGAFHRLTRAKIDLRRCALRVAPAQYMVLGGSVAAPVLSLAGWIGLLLPSTSGLHQAAPSLLAAAMIALGAAFAGAYSGERPKNAA